LKNRRILPALALFLFFLPLLPEILGFRLLVFRDAFITHYPIKLLTRSILRAGNVPFLNFGASNVEPLLSNPNTVTLYPTNLLYLVLPAAVAFNFHLLFHVAWAFFGASRLCRRLGAARSDSWIGGAVYAFGGPYLSYAAAFTNASAAAAWAPWAVACAVDLTGESRTDFGFRRGARWLSLGIAFGLQFLAGEPAISGWTAAAAAATILVCSLGRTPRPRLPPSRLVLPALAASLVALALSAPLLFSTAAAIPYSFRGEHSFSREQFNAAANVPVRALETFFPLLFGSPRPLVSGAFWGYRLFGSLQPYLYSANFGLAALILILSAFSLRSFRRSPRALGLAALTILFLTLSLGFSTPLFELLYAAPPLRHFRYPIKFLLPSSLFFAVLSALAFGEWRRTLDRRTLGIVAAAAALPLCAGVAFSTLGRGLLVQRLRGQFQELAFPPERVLPGILRIILFDSLLGLSAMLLLWVASRKSPPTVFLRFAFGAVLLGLLPAGWPLFVSAPASDYSSASEIASTISRSGRLWVAPIEEFAIVKTGSRQSYSNDDVAEVILSGRRELWPLTGVPDGVEYSFDRDPDGSYGFLDRVAGEAVAAAAPVEKGRLLRASSVRFVLDESPDPLPGFSLRARVRDQGRDLFLSEADHPLPIVRAATRIYRRSSLSGAVDLLKGRGNFEPERDVILRGPDTDPPDPGGAAAILESRRIGNGLEAVSSSAGDAIVVFAVTYFPYWRAVVDGRPARLEIADGHFCGVRVSPGSHRVSLEYDEKPFSLGAAGNLIFLGLTIPALLWFRKPRSPRAREE
jgi:hypothetical protein